eukprot:PhF_6_TR29916/c0_g1_i1/m.43857
MDEADHLTSRMNQLLESLEDLIHQESHSRPHPPHGSGLNEVQQSRQSRHVQHPPGRSSVSRPSIIKSGLHTCRVVGFPCHKARANCQACNGLNTSKWPKYNPIRTPTTNGTFVASPQESQILSKPFGAGRDGMIMYTNKPGEKVMRHIRDTLIKLQGSLNQQHTTGGNDRQASLAIETLHQLQDLQRQVDTLEKYV